VGRRPFASFHVLTLLLAALLAWPWNVILSAAEAFQVSNQARSSTVHPPAKSRLHRVSRLGHGAPLGCSVISPDYDYDEEEGDVDSPLSPWSIGAPSPILAYDDFSAPALAPLSPPPLVHLQSPARHLRC